MMRMFLTSISRRQQFECFKGIESMIMSDKGRVVHCTRVKAESEAHGRSRKERCSANRHYKKRDRNPVDLAAVASPQDVHSTQRPPPLPRLLPGLLYEFHRLRLGEPHRPRVQRTIQTHRVVLTPLSAEI